MFCFMLTVDLSFGSGLFCWFCGLLLVLLPSGCLLLLGTVCVLFVWVLLI